MKNKRFILLNTALVLSLCVTSVIVLANSDKVFGRVSVQAESTLQKTIDFEDISASNMSVTAHNSYYNGVIVADGIVTQTTTARIDGNTLGMKMPASSTTDSRVVVIKVSGYTKIVLDLVQEKSSTKISTGCSQVFSSKTNGAIVRDVEIPTYNYHEVTLTFTTTTSYSTAIACGIDNIRFYGPSGEGGGGETPVDPDTPTDDETRENTPAVIDGVITMKGIADFFETKEKHYPISDEFIETYQQTSGGYIDYAKELGLPVDKSKHEPDQKWHFFDSWLYRSIEDKTLTWSESAKSRVYTKLLCPELLLWIYEASDVPTSKVEAARNVAVDAKINSVNISTMAKNMRACVPWSDIETSINAYLDTLS